MIDVLLTGERPHQGLDERVLHDGGLQHACGVKFALSGTKHDMAARRETHREVRVPQATFCCPLCMASRNSWFLSHKDDRASAAVWKTMETNESYVATMGRSQWLSVSGFSYLRAQLDETSV